MGLSADFVAAEEIGRSRGYWWSPDGQRIAACRGRRAAGAALVDHRSGPAREPADGASVPGRRHRQRLGRRSRSSHSTAGPWRSIGTTTRTRTWRRRVARARRLLVTVQSRDQRTVVVLEADGVTGASFERSADSDDAWVELVPGVPGQLGRRAARHVRRPRRSPPAARRRRTGHATGPAGQIGRRDRRLGGRVPRQPARRPDGASSSTDGPPRAEWRRSSPSPVCTAPRSAGRRSWCDRPRSPTTRPRTYVLDGPALTGLGEAPLVEPNVTILRLGEDGIAAAVLLPRGVDPSEPLPVLLDPYGGPHAQRVVAAGAALRHRRSGSPTRASP